MTSAALKTRAHATTQCIGLPSPPCGIASRHHDLAGKALIIAALLMFMAQSAGAAQGQSDSGKARLGQNLLRENCSRCHAISKQGTSPLSIAPPFRILHERYPIEDLAESLGEGITTGHPTMPAFRFDPDQIENIIAYMKTLEH